MNVCIASDHAGFELKQKFMQKYDLIDLGTYDNQSCDYPIFAKKLVQYVLENHCFGVLICGTGIGMSIAANRHKNIRAALCSTPDVAELSRKHNDANVLVLGARIIDPETAFSCFEKFISIDFDGGRHLRRVSLIDEVS